MPLKIPEVFRNRQRARRGDTLEGAHTPKGTEGNRRNEKVDYARKRAISAMDKDEIRPFLKTSRLFNDDSVEWITLWGGSLVDDHPIVVRTAVRHNREYG